MTIEEVRLDSHSKIETRAVLGSRVDISFKLYTNTHPFEGLTIGEVLNAISNNQIPNDWISVKDRLPPMGLMVVAKNPLIEAKSWIGPSSDKKDFAWFHETWDHADDFVTHWKYYIPK